MPQRIRPSLVAALLVQILTAGGAPPPVAAAFAPITERERSLREAPGAPEAPAVRIFHNGRLTMMGTVANPAYSTLAVEGRIKILSEAGSDYGEVAVRHSDFVRLISFEGRTVLPDGSEVRLPEDALFREAVTGGESRYLTKAAFPALEPGAILDYRYELRFEAASDLSTWYFQSRIPTLHSEVTYELPRRLSFQPWGKATAGGEIQSALRRTARGKELKLWMDDLPGIPDEPLSLPFEHLSSSALLLSKRRATDDWRAVCNWADYAYRDARRRDGRTRQRGKEIAAAAGSDLEARARRIFAFVRDEIATVGRPWILPAEGESLDDMVREQRADGAGKALVLEAMLDAAGLDPELVWVADHRFGIGELSIVDLSIATPAWFEATLVRLELDGREVFLDPFGPGYGFGYLHPDLEGADALVYSRWKPRVIRLPERPYDASVRQAELDFRIHGEGRLSGTGRLELEGHHGARWFRREPTAAGRLEAATELLEESFPRFVISDVSVDGELEASSFEVRWSLEPREEEILGDQVSLSPSAPLGPVLQELTSTPAERRTPVLFAFADRNVVELTVTWPDGWVADVVPEPTSTENDAGAFVVQVAVDDEARTLHYRRRFDLVSRLVTQPRYGELRELYAAVSTSDAQDLVLYRP